MLPIPSPDLCEAARRDCENLKSCPYGVEKSIDSYNCERCNCYNPCRLHECPANEQCGFDVHRNYEGNVEYRPICRPGKLEFDYLGFIKLAYIAASR